MTSAGLEAPLHTAIGEGQVYAILAALGLMTVLLFWLTSESSLQGLMGGSDESPSSLKTFRKQYLMVWCCAIISDWLQGPYVYALYQSYGFSNEQNAVLFVCGFGASGAAGAFIGQFADKYGRKQAAIWYCMLVIGSCITKHFNNYEMLMLGRILGGCATSLVFSVFDSWMVSEHNMRHKFGEQQLGVTFGHQQFLSSCMAVTAGLVAQGAASVMPLTKIAGALNIGGYCGPFDAAIATAFVGMIVIGRTWVENYGDSHNSDQSIMGGIANAATYLQEPSIWMVGLSCALFEGSMYLWVFIWTPVITIEGVEKPPYGLIFTCFMVACMFGSKLFEILSRYMEASALLLMATSTACVAHFMMLQGLPEKRTSFLLTQFILFEICVGLYFPAAGTLKGRIVPESCRATIYNLFRVPLNVIVVLALLFKAEPPDTLLLTTMLLAVAGVLALGLRKYAGSGMKPIGRDGYDPVGADEIGRQP